MRRARDTGSTGVNLGLIVTPMLDMSFQILAFFIMTYHPSALEGHLAGSLAARDVGGPPPIVEPRAEAPQLIVDPDQLADVPTVIVRSSGVIPGTPDKLLVKSHTDGAPRQVADATVTWERARADLGGELKALRKEIGTDKADVRIEADADLRHEFVLQIYDVCKQAGFARIHFVPPPLERMR
jgi:biopolymer transport protein ExbD